MSTSPNYETPLWTLIGVVSGFALSYLYNLATQKKYYRTKTQEAAERIKRSMHLTNPKQTIQRLADLIPQFREREQIKILSEVGTESSLNASMGEVTQCVIEELRWICVLYEVDSGSFCELAKKSRKDKKRIKAVQNILWEILANIVEYTQSKNLLHSALNLLDILNNYSIRQGYEEVLGSSIELYKSIRQFSSDEIIKRLSSLKKSFSKSSFKNSIVSKFLNEINETIQIIENGTI